MPDRDPVESGCYFKWQRRGAFAPEQLAGGLPARMATPPASSTGAAGPYLPPTAASTPPAGQALRAVRVGLSVRQRHDAVQRAAARSVPGKLGATRRLAGRGAVAQTGLALQRVFGSAAGGMWAITACHAANCHPLALCCRRTRRRRRTPTAMVRRSVQSLASLHKHWSLNCHDTFLNTYTHGVELLLLHCRP